MKQLFTSFLLFFFGFIAFGQSEASILIDEAFENVSIEDVFAVLKNKYQLKVAYDYDAVRDISVNKTIQSDNLKSALDQLFFNTGLEYKLVEDHRVLIRKVENHTLLNENESKKNHFTFEGTILDSRSKSPLAFATIYCPATSKGTSADEAGSFTLNINTNKTEGTLTIQYLGYIPRVVTWKKGEDLSNIRIELETRALEFKEVTILEKLPAFSLGYDNGSTIFRASRLDNLPSFVGGNDIFRSIQLLPGISASDDLSSEIKIRGSSGDENMIILDGITLYKADHYFGIFSAVNANIVNQVKIYKNAFPVEYGGRTAGVVDLSSHVITHPKVSGIVQADLLTSNAYLAIPMGKNMGLLLGGRTTNKNIATSELFNLLMTNRETTNAQDVPQIEKGDPEFRFYDINAKWFWNMSPKTTLTSSFFRSYDKFRYDFTRIDTTRTNRRRDIAINTERFDEVAEWNNQGAAFQINHQWKPNLRSDINFAYSSYDDSQIINSRLIRRIEKLPSPMNPGGHPNNIRRIDTTFQLTNSAYNAIKGLELNLKNEWDLDERQKLTFGYHLVHNEVTFKLDVDNRKPINESGQGKQHSGYLQYDLSTMGNFNFGLGLRNTYYTITEKNYLSPRLNISYKINEHFKLKASSSRYYQFLRKNYREDRFGVAYEFWILSNGIPDKFPVSSSRQFMLGMNYLKGGFELDIEAYHKNIDGVTEFALAQNGFGNSNVIPTVNKSYAIFNGTGLSKGIDLLLKKSSGSYTGWLAYTLSKTTHRFPEINRGQAFPSQDDQRHQLKIVNQLSFRKLDLSATFVYSSGRPYTDLSKIRGNQDREVLRPEDRISLLPDYYRIDLGASYNFDWDNTKGRIGASIFNLLNRQNVKYRQYIYSIPNQRDSGLPNIQEVRGTDLLMLGFTPNVSLSLEF